MSHVGNVKAENFVISLVQMHQSLDVFSWNLAVEFPQQFVRVSVSVVDISGGKLDVCVISETRYLTQNMLGVLMKCLVMTDKVVLDVTGLTEIVLWSPVGVKILFAPVTLHQNMLNELFEFHAVSSLQRSGNHTN